MKKLLIVALLFFMVGPPVRADAASTVGESHATITFTGSLPTPLAPGLPPGKDPISDNEASGGTPIQGVQNPGTNDGSSSNKGVLATTASTVQRLLPHTGDELGVASLGMSLIFLAFLLLLRRRRDFHQEQA